MDTHIAGDPTLDNASSAAGAAAGRAGAGFRGGVAGPAAAGGRAHGATAASAPRSRHRGALLSGVALAGRGCDGGRRLPGVALQQGCSDPARSEAGGVARGNPGCAAVASSIAGNPQRADGGGGEDRCGRSRACGAPSRAGSARSGSLAAAGAFGGTRGRPPGAAAGGRCAASLQAATARPGAGGSAGAGQDSPPSARAQAAAKTAALHPRLRSRMRGVRTAAPFSQVGTRAGAAGPIPLPRRLEHASATKPPHPQTACPRRRGGCAVGFCTCRTH